MKLKLTKSRFKLALECPVKLYYTGKKGYPDIKVDNPFLQALAEGGFQVGELAKLYYPGGYNIDTIDYDEALAQTNELLKMDNVTIFEAAVLYNDLFIRIDILEKKGNRLNLIEVKAKSIALNEDHFLTPKGNIQSAWAPYLFDAAFQKYVLIKAFPEYEVSTYLMLANKNTKASVEGLNQRFLLQQDKRGRTYAKVTDTSDTGSKLLATVKVDDECNIIYAKRYTLENADLSFEEYVNRLADAYINNRKTDHPVGKHCGSCEFQASDEQMTGGMHNGFRECWQGCTSLKEDDFKEQLIFSLWNFRGKQGLIDNSIYLLKDIDESIFSDVPGKESGLTPDQRKILQIQKVKKRDNTPYIDRKGLKTEMETWVFPLHMIDFETTAVAIPFNCGRRPYEGIAFQFSHHVIYDDGTVEHKGQFINAEQGHFPNYDFIRALKIELAGDKGSVFRYATHENTYLNIILTQIEEDESFMPDRDELIKFIKSITCLKDEKNIYIRRGERDMIDLLEIVKKYYYHPLMKGSNSIKVVLPAVMESEFIQQKYSKPIYGGKGPVKSLNFKDHVWVQKDSSGKIISPYKLLPPLFEGLDPELLDSFLTNESLADGGAAMTAYARMQFTEMTQLERKHIIAGLLRYCELDTLAMVLIYEYFRSEIK